MTTLKLTTTTTRICYEVSVHNMLGAAHVPTTYSKKEQIQFEDKAFHTNSV